MYNGSRDIRRIWCKMNEKNIEVFETMKISRAVAKMAVPSILGMLVTIAYNIADTMFVSWTGDPNQVAAVSIATPVFMLLMAVGNVFAVGGGTFISRLLGKKQYETVKTISAICIYGSAAFGVLAAVLYIIFKEKLLMAVGTSSQTYDFAKQYLDWISMGAFFVTLQFALGGIIRAEGSAKYAVRGMMLGTVLNIILDPIFILKMDLGCSGAAIATIIGNIASCIYYFHYILTKQTFLCANIKALNPTKALVLEIVTVGLPSSITNTLMSLSNILMNICLVTYGDNAVASMGIAMKAMTLVILVQIGLAGGLQPLIAYNFAAHNFKRMDGILRTGILWNVCIGVSLTILYMIFTPQIVRIFINDEEILIQGAKFLRRLVSPGPIVGIMFVFQFGLQAMGKALATLFLAVSRQGIIFVPILLISNRFFGLNGIVWAQPVADFVSTFTAIILFTVNVKKSMKSIQSKTQEVV